MNAVNIRIIALIALICWLAANTPLVAASTRHRKSIADLWLTLTSTPNRYLFSLVFMPAMFFAAFTIWALAQRCLDGALTQNHPVLAVLTSNATLLLSSLAICSAVTLWDFAAGNYNNADLKRPYGIAALRARDILLDSAAPPDAAESSATFEQLTVLLASSSSEDASVAKEYLKRVASRRRDLVDPLMVYANLVNVWFFTLTVWLSAYLLIVLAVAKQAGAVTNLVIFDMCKFPVLFCIVNIALWGSFRSYELNEFKEAMGRESGETIDLVMGAFVLIVLCLLAAWAFQLSAIELVGAALIPLGFIIGSQFFTSLVRTSYGSAMSFPNFLLVVFLWNACCGALTLVFASTKA